MDVGGRREGPAVAVAAHRQVQHVGSQRRLGGEVAEGDAAGQLVGAEEGGVDHPGGRAHPFLHEVVESGTARPLGDQGQHDVTAVAVGEVLAGCRHARMPVEHGEELLGGRQLVHRHRQHIVVRRVELVLVQVVADTRSVRQQVLDRDGLVDQREVGAEHRAGGRRQVEHTVGDQADHGERGQRLAAAGDGESDVDGVGDAPPAVGQPVGGGELDRAVAVDAHHAREPGLGGYRIDGVGQTGHRRRVLIGVRAARLAGGNRPLESVGSPDVNGRRAVRRRVRRRGRRRTGRDSAGDRCRPRG